MKTYMPVLAGLMLCLVVAALPGGSADWPMFQGSLDKSGYYNGTLPEDNTTMWTQQTGLWNVNTPAIVDGIVYYGSYDYHVYAVDARNGEVVWKTPLDWIVVQSSPAVDVEEGLVYIGSLNKLFALNMTTGEVEWWFHGQQEFLWTGWPEVGCPAFHDGYVYYGSVDGYLYKFPAHDPDGDGEMTLLEAEWSFMSGDIVPSSKGIFYAPVTVCPDRGFVLGATAMEGGTNPGELYAVNIDSGDLAWSYEFSSTSTPIINISIPGMGSHSGSGPSYDLDSNIVWCPNADRLYAVDLDDGSELYVKTANDWIMGQTPSWDDDYVYIGDDAGNLTAYDKTTGVKAWEMPVGGPIRTSPIHDANGNIYTVWNGFGPDRGYVVCINKTTRDVVWEQPLGGWVLLAMSADDGVLFVCDADVTTAPFYSHLYAIGPKTVDVDLQVKGVLAPALKEDEPGYMVAQVFNDGTASAWDFEVKFYRGDPDMGGSLIGTVDVSRARPGESTPAVIEWAPTASGDLEIYAVADPSNDVDETVEGNNKGSGTVQVLTGDTAPTADIGSISPDDVYADGTTISFSGSASDIDGTIETYEWSSHIDGYLGGEEDFDLASDTLTAGAHLITFRAQDDDGLWSANDTAMLIVRSEASDDWNRSGHDSENTGFSTSGNVVTPTVEWYTSYEVLTGETALASPTVVDGVAYVCTLNTTYAFDADDGSELWQHRMPDDWFWGQAATPAVSVEHGVIAINGFDIIVLDIEDGSEVWSLDMVGDFELAGPLIYGDRLYVHNLGYANITCFDLATGAEQWNFAVNQDYLWSSPSIGFDHLYVTSFSTSDDLEGYYATYALNLGDGSLDWRWRLGDGSVGGIGIPFVGAALSISSPTVCTYNGVDMVIVADITGNVYAFEPDGEQPRDFVDSDGSGPNPIDGAQDDGEIIWQTDLGEDTIASTSYHDGRVYLATWFGNLTCLDASDGGLVWRTGIGMPFWSAPSINNDTLYLAGIDSYIYCFDVSDGSLIWRHLTRPYTFIYSTPTLYGDSMFVTGGYGPNLLWTDGVYRIGPYIETPDLAVADELVLPVDPSPVDGDIVEVMVGVVNHGTADAVGAVALFLDDPTWSKFIGYGTVEVAAGGTGGISFLWNTTGLFGDHELIAMVICREDPMTSNDAAATSVYVSKLGEKPFANIDLIDPNPVERKSGNAVSFVGSGHSAGEIVSYQWNYTGPTDGELSTEASFSEDVMTFQVGKYTISLSVEDEYGKWSEEVTAELSVVAESGKPTASILEISPNPAETEDTITFRGEGIYDKEIVEYRWEVNDGFLSDDAEFEYDAADIGGPNSYLISFEVRGSDGKWSDPDTETLVITSGEPPVLTILTPEDGADVEGVVEISGEVESEDEVEKVEIAITGVGGTPDYDNSDIVVDGTDVWSSDWDTGELGGGDYEIHVRATTVVDTEDEEMITVTVLSDAPSVQITDPEDDDTVYGTIDILGTAADQDGTVESVEIRFETGSWQQCEITDQNGSTYDWEFADWDTTDFPDGSMVTIRVRATDDDDNVGSVSIRVEVMNTGIPPEVEILVPDEGDVAAYELHVEGTADDPDADGSIEEVLVSIVPGTGSPDWGEAYVASGTTYWSLDINVSLFEDRDYTIYARAEDDDGMFSDPVSVEMRIDNRRPVAVIESITPGMARWGKDTIILRGHGEDGDIVAFEWRSQLNGFLGDTDTVSIPSSEFSIGEHVISFRVKGANGVWSAEVSQVLSVVKAKDKDDDDDGWLPGMEVTAVAIALVAALAAVTYTRRSK